MKENRRIRPRVRDAVLQSLRAGVVPRIGQQYFQVGRVEELKAMLRDLERIVDGGSAIRFIIGEYGSGKTFFLLLIRSIAFEKRMVTAHADLSPDRRLHAAGGQARSLYQELARNLSTRSKPDGGALPSIVERFVSTALKDARELGKTTEAVIQGRLEALSQSVGGYDFAEVIGAYWRGHDTGDEALKSSAIRWLRGEFATKTDARKALGVRTIVDDKNVYDQLKLLGQFVRLAGYSGFLVCLDEMVNLYKLPSGQSRRTNYEQILRIFNDTLQGTCEGIGFLFGGTPEFLLDPRKGLYSYAALQTRLAENTFAVDGLVDYSNPILRLARLTPEDILVLLGKLRDLHAGGDLEKHILPEEALEVFLQHCGRQLGEAAFRTPRTTVKGFCDLLAVLEQNPDADWKDMIGKIKFTPDRNPELEAPGAKAEDNDDDDDELSTLKL